MANRTGLSSELVVAHTSDLHLGVRDQDEELERLADVVSVATGGGARVLLLAGDTFDHNRVPLELVDRAASLLSESGLRTVILPGNHDCLAPGSVYARSDLPERPNLDVLGITAGESVTYRDLDLEVWGRPHLDYDDFAPLGDPGPRRTAWRVVMAHGHWEQGPGDAHRAYRFTEGEIAALEADYVALGHWDWSSRVGNGGVPAYYSGSPHYVGAINLVHFRPQSGPAVSHVSV